MAENEYGVLLDLELNPASVNRVKEQIKNLKVDPIKIDLEFANTQSQVQKIKNEIQSLNKIKIDFGSTSNVNSSNGTTKQLTSEYQHLMSIVKQISSLTTKKVKLNVDTNSNEFKEIQKQIINLVSEYNEARQSLNKPLTISQSNNITAEFQKTADKIKILRAELSDKEINFANNFDLGKADLQIKDFESQIKALEGNSGELNNELKNLSDTLQNVKNSLNNNNFDEAVKGSEQYSQSADRLKAKLKEVKVEQDTISKGKTLSNNIVDWLNKNVKAAEKYGEELRKLAKDAQNIKVPTEFNNINRRFSEIKSEAKAAGLTTSSFASSLKDAALQALGLGSTYMVFQKIVGIIKQGVETVKELDDSLIDLKKTTSMSNDELGEFYKDANSLAKKYNTTTKQIIQGAADWSRLGYNDKQSASLMSQYSSQMAAISPGMTVDQSTEGLVSTMKAYKIEADDVLDGIMSKINEVGKLLPNFYSNIKISR